LEHTDFRKKKLALLTQKRQPNRKTRGGFGKSSRLNLFLWRWESITSEDSREVNRV